jgi:cytochrome c oxidase subunit 3
MTDHPEHDATGSRLGMWIFLYSEIMLFVGLFVLFAGYFREYHADFVAAGRELNRIFGVANTVILLASSFTVAASITAVRRGNRRGAMVLVAISILCGLAFLVNKYFEWGHKFHLGLYPNSPVLLRHPHGEVIFYGLYYAITGLHGIHILIGLTLLSVCLGLLARGRMHAGRDVVLENSGLYWHLVDLIWIFIFPLFYLIL